MGYEKIKLPVCSSTLHTQFTIEIYWHNNESEEAGNYALIKFSNIKRVNSKKYQLQSNFFTEVNHKLLTKRLSFVSVLAMQNLLGLFI